MPSIVGSISGQFSKSLLIGTLLPVTVYIILFRVVVLPLFPDDSPLLDTFDHLSTEWQALVGTLIAVVLGGLLYMFNGPLIRFLEGYPWQDGWLGSRFIARQLKRFEAARARRGALRDLFNAVRNSTDQAVIKNASDVRELWSESGQIFNTEFPESEGLVLPTRLGNAIRAFEMHANRRYGMAPIALWPRLTAVIPETHTAAMDDAKTSFDFMLNASFLAWLFGLSMLAGGALHPGEIAVQSWWFIHGPTWWLLGVVLSFAMAVLFYVWSIGFASNWGELVASAFDLYRNDLLKQLGFSHPPETIEDERAVWRGISDWIRTDDIIFAPDRRYAPQTPPFVRCYVPPLPDAAIDLRLTRTAGPPRVDGTIEITLLVTNRDSARRAESVLIVDRVPDDFELIGSTAIARLAGASHPLALTGTNPFQFRVGSLPARQSVSVSYRMFKH